MRYKPERLSPIPKIEHSLGNQKKINLHQHDQIFGLNNQRLVANQDIFYEKMEHDLQKIGDLGGFKKNKYSRNYAESQKISLHSNGSDPSKSLSEQKNIQENLTFNPKNQFNPNSAGLNSSNNDLYRMNIYSPDQKSHWHYVADIYNVDSENTECHYQQQYYEYLKSMENQFHLINTKFQTFRLPTKIPYDKIEQGFLEALNFCKLGNLLDHFIYQENVDNNHSTKNLKFNHFMLKNRTQRI